MQVQVWDVKQQGSMDPILCISEGFEGQVGCVKTANMAAGVLACLVTIIALMHTIEPFSRTCF